jgi:uncharacterized protein (TIGR02145 family)
MAENLAYLPEVNLPYESSPDDPFHYVYDYFGTSIEEAKATSNYQTYGVLYHWPAAIEGCPTDWHLPTDEEWTVLLDYLGGESVAGGKLKEEGTTHWKYPNEGATDEYGFAALPSGFRDGSGFFIYIKELSFWWTASESR